MNIFIDGTWNVPKDKSNIHRLFKKYGGEYFTGPGTQALMGDIPFLSKWLGGVFGFGTQAIVNKAYKKIKKYLSKNPKTYTINIFGFSRGSYAARMLAAKLAKEGIIVNFLGCFDTVGAMGVPVNIFGIPFQQINLFSDAHVHSNVKRAAHAQALDEKRPAFVGTPMEFREGIVQRGFNGDHWKIGSSDVTLNWMIEQFED